MKDILSKIKSTLDEAVDKPESTNLFGKQLNYNPAEEPEYSDSDSDGYQAKKEAREYIRSFLKVENESALIKDRVENKRDWKYGTKAAKTEGLYDLSKWNKIQGKDKNSQVDLHQQRDEEFDEDEDQKIAFELLNKYKQDKGFIQRDLKKLKFVNKNMKEIVDGSNQADLSSKPTPMFDDVALRMEQRHKELKEQKDKRRKERMEKLEQEKKLRDEEQRILKANLDLEGVLVDDIKPKTTKKLSTKAKSMNKESQLVGLDPSDRPNGNEFDDRISQLRQKCDNYTDEFKQCAEDVEKIKEMVRKEVEELKNIDRIKKFQQIEMIRKRELEEEKNRLEQERINAEREMK